MASRTQYQYETSPRKMNPLPNKKKVANVNESNLKNDENRDLKKKTEKRKTENKKIKLKIVLYVVCVFAVVFAIGYRDAQINEQFRRVEKLKTQLTELKKENDQLEVGIESSLNLSNIETIAKEVLGMRKLDNSQKIYVDLPKREYIEPSTEKVVIKETTWFDEFLKMLSNLW